MIYRKAINYDNFMQLPAEERKEHANYFHKNHPQHCPVILKVQHAGKQISLRMCKFLIRQNFPMGQQQQLLRSYIIRHSQGQITSKDLLSFWYNRKLIDQNILVKDFLKYYFKDTQNDGWLHITVTTQEAY